MWISKRLGLYLKTWRCMPGGPVIGKTRWSNKTLRGTPFFDRPRWSLNFWVGRRMFCITRNAC